MARSSMGDDSMDLTMAIGGIQESSSPAKSRRRSAASRQHFVAEASQPEEDATMDVTRAFGGIKTAERLDQTTSSFDENEELTMELTVVIRDEMIENVAPASPDQMAPSTPQLSTSPLKSFASLTPKDQDRFKDVPDSGPRKLLTPMLQKQIDLPKEEQILTDANDISTPAESKNMTLSPEPRAEHHTRHSDRTTRSITHQVPPPATPENDVQQLIDAQLQDAQHSPLIEKQQRSSPTRLPASEPPTMLNAIKLMSTPRKETLKSRSPQKHTPAARSSPSKSFTPQARPTPNLRAELHSLPNKNVAQQQAKTETSSKPVQKVHLQEFLDSAGIRFMDITATKRRMTIAPTPSKIRRDAQVEEEDRAEATLGPAIIAAACTQPEHDMYQHACHELKHYMSEGRKIIKQLEVETYREQPPLLQDYVNASAHDRAILDSQMRDMKTHARFKSKEMWYGWRSQLLNDLIKGVSSIGDSLAQDELAIKEAEDFVEGTVPDLIAQHDLLHEQANALEEALTAIPDDEREELEGVRAQLARADKDLDEKRRLLEQLEQEGEEQEALIEDLAEARSETAAVIQEAERVREACRGISQEEITTLTGQ